jgi:hypothetical protein
VLFISRRLDQNNLYTISAAPVMDMTTDRRKVTELAAPGINPSVMISAGDARFCSAA